MTTTTRYASAAALGCVYTVLAIWLVGMEGRSYRKSIRHERDRDLHATTESQAPAPTVPAPPLATSPSAPAVTQPETAVAKTDSRTAPELTVAPSQAVPAPSVAPAPVQATAPAEASPRTLAANAAAKATPLPPEGLRPPSTPAPRSAGADWADSLDLTRLTPQNEARLGAELHQLVMRGNQEDKNGDIQRLRRAAEPLLKNVARKEVEYKFIILDSDEVNAFSLPGGYIYVSRGLFHLVGEDTDPEQDYSLEFALGHEIAHVDLKHGLDLVALGNAAAKAKGIDTLNQFLVPVVLGFPDAQEFAADTWTYSRMTTLATHTRREALMFLVKLKGFSEHNEFRNGRQEPDLQSGRTLVENHYRAHPAAWDRLDRLKSRAALPVGSGANAAAALPPR